MQVVIFNYCMRFNKPCCNFFCFYNVCIPYWNVSYEHKNIKIYLNVFYICKENLFERAIHHTCFLVSPSSHNSNQYMSVTFTCIHKHKQSCIFRRAQRHVWDCRHVHIYTHIVPHGAHYTNKTEYRRTLCRQNRPPLSWRAVPYTV